MPVIEPDNALVTQITTVKVSPESQDEVIEVMTERARFMETQPGFVSVSLHRSHDGSHVVQWKGKKELGLSSP